MRTTGQTISWTVENMLALVVAEDRGALARLGTARRVYSEKMNLLADALGVSQPYMPRKIKMGTWSAEDLDNLAEFFSMYPDDFVPGLNDWGKDVMAQQLREKIKLGGLQPGEPIPGRAALQRTYGVPLSVIEEVLKSLTNEGLLERDERLNRLIVVDAS